MKNHRGREHEEHELDRGREFFERIIHDAGEFGEENVEEIDREWSEFENFMRWVLRGSCQSWLLIPLSHRDYRERRLSTTSMDNQPRRREKRVKTQAFYPSPASFSEPDQYEYDSDDDDDDETTSYDGDGFKKTLVREPFVLECKWNAQAHRNYPHESSFAMKCERNNHLLT